MVIDKPRSLQMSVANGRPEEFESPFFHILAHSIGISLNERKVLIIGFLSGKNGNVYS